MKVTIWVKDRDLPKLQKGEAIDYTYHNPQPLLNNCVQVQLTYDELVALDDKRSASKAIDPQLELLLDSPPKAKLNRMLMQESHVDRQDGKYGDDESD